MLGVKVEKKGAEKAKKALEAEGVLDRSSLIFSDGTFVYIPVKSQPKNFETVQASFKQAPARPRNLSEALASKMSPEAISQISKSFDIVGDVAVLEISKLGFTEEILVAQAIRQVHTHVHTVCKKMGNVETDFRVRPLKILIGSSTETIHKEFGVKLKLDIAKVYFSPRYANERMRVAKLVKPKEKVCVMFAGVGPYPLLMARRQPSAYICAIEANPVASAYLEENVKLNKAKNVAVIAGDVKDVVPKLKKKFDRVVMPLPKGGENFLNEAVSVLKRGGVLHFYQFQKEPKLYDSPTKKIKEAAGERKVKILRKLKCGEIGPRAYRVVIDAQIT